MNKGRIFLGIVVLGVGVLLLLGNFDVLVVSDLVDWWPALIIVAGVLSLTSNLRQWPISAVVIIFGATLLLSTLDVLVFGDVIVPAALIAVGLIIILGRRMGSRVSGETMVDSFVVFAGSEISSHSKEFRGGNASAVFGGVELDLRDAVPAPGASLDVLAAFGGVEVIVPAGWQVTANGFPIFGAIENATSKESLPAGAPHLEVNATVLFGALEIKH